MTGPHGDGWFLGLETSGTSTAAALIDGNRVLAEAVETGTAHNEVLLPLVARLFSATATTPAGLAGIGVTIGPGMFTSLRVGLATAKALAIAHSIPLAGVDTFAALAASVGAADTTILAVVDARKQQVYAALIAGSNRLLGPLIATPAELAARVAEAVRDGHRILVAGSGSALCLPLLVKAGLAADDSGVGLPSAAAVGRLARTRIGEGRADEVGRLEPLYLRRTDAELVRGQNAAGQTPA